MSLLTARRHGCAASCRTVRRKQITGSRYKPAPDGLAGNGDRGQMTAWLIRTAPGRYRAAPGSDNYAIGRPLIEAATPHCAQRHDLQNYCRTGCATPSITAVA
jgi:putative alpha-1,2-mannosidase